MGIVYLIGDYSKNHCYKIGVTRGKLENRLKKLQTGNSGQLFVKYSYSSDYPFVLEEMLHNRHESDKIINEWYYLEDEQVDKFLNECEELQSVINSLKDNYFFNKKHGKNKKM